MSQDHPSKQPAQTLQQLFAQHTDTAKYDAVVFIGLSGVSVSNLGVAGSIPAGADPKKYIFSKLQEATFGLAFSKD